jgi:hypothetical protein
MAQRWDSAEVPRGEDHPDDEALRRLAAALLRRCDLAARIGKRDQSGNGGRAVAVGALLDEAGPDLVWDLAKSMPSESADSAVKLHREIGSLQTRLEAVAPETQRFGELKAQLAAMQEQLGQLRQTGETERRHAAETLLESARTGTVQAVAALEDALLAVGRPSAMHPLIESIRQIRATPADYLGVIAELIGSASHPQVPPTRSRNNSWLDT